VSGLGTALEALGHPVTIVEKVAGGMNGVLVDEDGWLHGAACWRADGVPIGISGGQSRASTESGVVASQDCCKSGGVTPAVSSSYATLLTALSG